MQIEAVAFRKVDVEQDPAAIGESCAREVSTRNRKKSLLTVAILLILSACATVGIIVSAGGNSQNTEEEPNAVLPTNPRQTARRLSSVSGGYGPQKLSADMANPRVLNVHVVPHTHDDVGWLKTVEQYYHGLNNTIQDVCVKDIWDTVVAALLENEARTFTYVETKFFSMWWNEQTDEVKDSVRHLIANEQLTFTNGGWCMHGKGRILAWSMGSLCQFTLLFFLPGCR